MTIADELTDQIGTNHRGIEIANIRTEDSEIAGTVIWVDTIHHNVTEECSRTQRMPIHPTDDGWVCPGTDVPEAVELVANVANDRIDPHGYVGEGLL